MVTQNLERDAQVSQVLLIEDNPSDVVLVQESLKESNIQVKLNVVLDGTQAMDYLRRNEPFQDAPVPHLIILDINMPKVNGLEVLQEIKADPLLKHIPVVVLTTSRSDKDILKTYGLGATCFITKPLGFYEFMESVKSIVGNFLTPRP